MPAVPMIRLYGYNDSCIEQPVRLKFTPGTTRLSTWAASAQRQLDLLVALYPTALRAEIDGPRCNGHVDHFRVVEGRSHYTLKP